MISGCQSDCKNMNEWYHGRRLDNSFRTQWDPGFSENNDEEARNAERKATFKCHCRVTQALWKISGECYPSFS